MEKVIYRRLIELLIILLICWILMYRGFDGEVGIIYFATTITIISFMLLFMVLIELITRWFSPVTRMLFALFFHIVFLVLGLLTVNFGGAVIQELASNEILPQTLSDVKFFLPYIISLWGTDELIRYIFREQSSVI